jgi:hypothetical protein
MACTSSSTFGIDCARYIAMNTSVEDYGNTPVVVSF